MQVTATVKIMGEEALFNAKLEAFCQSGIGVGDTVLVSVRFTARTYRTGFFRTEAEIMTICKA